MRSQRVARWSTVLATLPQCGHIPPAPLLLDKFISPSARADAGRRPFSASVQCRAPRAGRRAPGPAVEIKVYLGFTKRAARAADGAGRGGARVPRTRRPHGAAAMRAARFARRRAAAPAPAALRSSGAPACRGPLRSTTRDSLCTGSIGSAGDDGRVRTRKAAGSGRGPNRARRARRRPGLKHISKDRRRNKRGFP